MAFLTVAPCVLAKDQAGRIHYHYESVNPVIPWLSDEQAEHFLSEGLVIELDEDDVEDPTGPVKPAHAATKPLWVEFVVAKTADTENPVTAEEADKLTKDDLIALYGGE